MPRSYQSVAQEDAPPTSSSAGVASPLTHVRNGRFLYDSSTYQFTEAANEARDILEGRGGAGDMENNMKHSRDITVGTKYHDVPFALLFIAHLFIFGYLAYSHGWYLLTHGGLSSSFSETTFNPSVYTLFLVIAISSFSSLLLSFLFIEFMKAYVESVMSISLYLYLATIAGLTVAYVATAHASPIVILLNVGVAVITIVYFLSVRYRIPFALSMLRPVLSSLTSNRGPVVIIMFTAIVMQVWLFLWILGSSSILSGLGLMSVGGYDAEQNYNPHSSAMLPMLVFLIFCLYWTTQVITNLAHTIVSGAIAGWWLLPSFMRDSITTGATKRAMTKSFGSVCLGSMLVAVVKTVRSCISFFIKEDETSFTQLCLNCLLELVERMLTYFNHYAYTYVSVYGDSYTRSSFMAYELFRDKNMHLVVNDDITNMPIFLGCVSVTLVNSAITFVACHILHANTASMIAYASIAALVSLLLSSHILSVISSGVSTTFVVWADMPREMSAVQPEYYREIQKTFNELY